MLKNLATTTARGYRDSIEPDHSSNCHKTPAAKNAAKILMHRNGFSGLISLM
jgi:hypothetical protein